MISSCTIRIFAIRVLALFSFLGGPLYWADVMKQDLDKRMSFAIAFTPVALLVLGALTGLEDAPKGFSRFVVWVGAGGGLVLVIMNVVAAFELLTGAHHPDKSLVIVGIVVGFAAVVGYFSLAWRFLRSGGRGSH